MIKEYNEEIGRKLYGLVKEFIIEYGISCPESIHQCDPVMEDCPLLLEDLCRITGYYEYEEE
jgi:hypothetical protein